VAFPMAVGVGLVLGSVLGLVSSAASNATLVLLGCILILTSVVVNAIAYRIVQVQRHEQLARAGVAKSTRRPNPVKGILLCVFAGLLLGCFGGLIGKARGGELGLGPYALTALFALGVFVSSLVYGVFFMNLPVQGEPLEFPAFFKSPARQHFLGLTGGILWYLGTLGAWIAISVPESLQPGPPARQLLLQAYPIVAALFGIFAWKELKGGDMRLKILAALMIALFLCGLAMLGLAPAYLVKG